MFAFHVAGAIEDGEPETLARSLDELQRDPIFREDSANAMVSLLEIDLPGKAVRVNISVEAAGESRSGFLTQAATKWLATAV